jgi:hypothetical protein
MKESCCQFGPLGQLAGILTEPDAPAPRVALVLVSAGLSPKCGPFRLYAELARRLSRDGVLTLRFDLGGIGDSHPEYAGLLLEERTKLEIKAAMDHLTERYELEGIILGGLCSGAEDAFRSAEVDQRVTGVVLMDPFGYRTAGWMWRHVLYRSTRRILRALGIHRPLVRLPVGRPGGVNRAKSLVTYKYMDHEESSRILRTLVKRKGHVHFVYTGGAREVFNHEHQLKAMFSDVDFDGRVTLNHFPRVEHTQLLEEDRHSVVEAIARRLGSARESLASSAEKICGGGEPTRPAN